MNKNYSYMSTRNSIKRKYNNLYLRFGVFLEKYCDSL